MYDFADFDKNWMKFEKKPIIEAGTPRALKHINSDVWYKICTIEDMHKNLKESIHLSFLLRDCNECSAESNITDINYV